MKKKSKSTDEVIAEVQNWKSSSESQLRQHFGDYGDGTFGGYDSSGHRVKTGRPGEQHNIELPGDSPDFNIFEYQREQARKQKGFTPSTIKADPALQGIIYNCSHKGCIDRLMVGVRNSKHVKYTEANIKGIKWGFSASRSIFFCPVHKYECQRVDVLRDAQTGEPKWMTHDLSTHT